MKIEYGGRIWDFSLLDMDVAQCEAVEKHVGKGMGEWANQLMAGSSASLVALWWVIRKQNGESPGPVSQPGDDFRPLKLLNAFAEAEQAEQAQEEPEPDPIRPPAVSSPASAATPTTPASTPLAPSLPG